MNQTVPGSAIDDKPSFGTVTELPGSLTSPIQLDMARTRYDIAAKLGEGKDVLELACGAGIGLPYIAARARTVIGGDVDAEIVAIAASEAAGRYDVREMSAQELPFGDQTFDLVVLLEAIYYLPDAQSFLREAHRVLRPGGCVFVCSANIEWDGFNPSPFSTRYFTLRDLGELLASAEFAPELRVGFPVARRGARQRVLGWMRRTAVRLKLIPSTMKGKELLKRLAYGKLIEMPRHISADTGTVHPTEPYTGRDPVSDYQVLYAIGRRLQ